MGILDYSIDPSDNANINGIGIMGSSPVSNFDNALRQSLADSAAGITRHVEKAAGTYTAAKSDNRQLWRAIGDATFNLAGRPAKSYSLTDAPTPAVPEIISDRQFFQHLANLEIITQDEALAAVRTGDIPPAMLSLIQGLPEADQFAATMLTAGATEFRRAHPLTAAFGAAFGWTDAQIDQCWTEAAEL